MATEKDPPYTEIQFFACAEERCFYEKTTVRQPDCNSCRSAKAGSYTHLDVYKRQDMYMPDISIFTDR